MDGKLLRVHGALFLVNAIYAAGFTITKEAMPAYIRPSGFILLRISGALIFIFIYQRLAIREVIRDRKDLIYIAGCALFGVAINMLLFFQGLSRTSPIHGALLMVTTPVLVFIIGFFTGKERMNIPKVSGILLGAIGAGLLILGRHAEERQASILGDSMIFVNAASYALFLVMVRPMMSKYNPITVIMYSFVFGLFMVAPFGYKELSEVVWSSFSPGIWAAVSFTVIGTTFIAYVLNGWALKHVKSSVVGGYIYVQPLLGTLIAVLSHKYELFWYHIIYGLMIFTGVYLVSRREKEPVITLQE